MESSDVSRGKVILIDRRGHQRGVTGEAFFNQYCVFLLLAESGFIPIGKRIVVTRSIPTTGIHR